MHTVLFCSLYSWEVEALGVGQVGPINHHNSQGLEPRVLSLIFSLILCEICMVKLVQLVFFYSL